MIEESAATSGSRSAEIVTACPDCGQILVRPEDFSGDRILYLHRKWSGCAPAEIDLRDGASGDLQADADAVVATDFPAVTPGY